MPPVFSYYGGNIMAEFNRDASEAGQKQIADAINKLALSVSVDDTLAVEGAAADAKATGDKIADLVEDINAIEEDITDLQGLISSDISVYTLFGKVITFEQDGTITWAEPDNG